MISLGIDSGTQSTKTIALDLESGKILAAAPRSYGLIEGLPPGHLEQEPQQSGSTPWTPPCARCSKSSASTRTR